MKKILLIGDDCIDVYQYGRVESISPEAPVPIFIPTDTITKPGMVSNVENNFRALGCDVFSFKGTQSRKTRLLDVKSNHHLLRLDEDVKSEPFSIKKINSKIKYDAVVLVDYNKGFITEENIPLIKNYFKCPVFVDSKKKDLRIFEGCFLKINEKEHSLSTSLPTDVIITRGENSVIYKDKRIDVPRIEVVDVCGAGDTFLSAFTFKYLDNNNIEESIKFAIKASSITLKHIGTYSPNIEEILCD